MPPRSRMRALSIRQPYAELILRGEKTIEYRSRPTKMIGRRFYIYASKGGMKALRHEGTKGCGSWPASLPSSLSASMPECLNALPCGVIVGSAVIRECVRNNGHYEWHLSDVKRMKRPRKVKRQPQPVWFLPW